MIKSFKIVWISFFFLQFKPFYLILKVFHVIKFYHFLSFLSQHQNRYQPSPLVKKATRAEGRRGDYSLKGRWNMEGRIRLWCKRQKMQKWKVEKSFDFPKNLPGRFYHFIILSFYQGFKPVDQRNLSKVFTFLLLVS